MGDLYVPCWSSRVFLFFKKHHMFGIEGAFPLLKNDDGPYRKPWKNITVTTREKPDSLLEAWAFHLLAGAWKEAKQL